MALNLSLSFRLLRCEARDCGALSALCLRCDRGQRYCVTGRAAGVREESCRRPSTYSAAFIAPPSSVIYSDEALQRRFRADQKTPEGRARLRERVPVEHSLSHQRASHGRFARYRGVAKNDFNAQRSAAMNNLHVIDRRLRRAGVEELAEAA